MTKANQQPFRYVASNALDALSELLEYTECESMQSPCIDHKPDPDEWCTHCWARSEHDYLSRLYANKRRQIDEGMESCRTNTE
jgi:hypothetical protein